MLRVHWLASESRASSQHSGRSAHPIEAATSAVAAALANAHERGDAASVRILHAVLALLSATPKREQH
jgi:hypothetical protein